MTVRKGVEMLSVTVSDFLATEEGDCECNDISRHKNLQKSLLESRKRSECGAAGILVQRVQT